MIIPEIQNYISDGRKIVFNSIIEVPYVKKKMDLESEEYKINIDENGIKVEYGNERGLFYAEKTINDLIENYREKSSINYCSIHDYPKFKLRGIIEGFYGTPWKHSERIDLIKFISTIKMNTFFYAPKDDLYHRAKWRENYPEEKFEEIKELVSCSIINNVDFIFSISPGVDITYSSDEDFKLLCNKLYSIKDLGVKKVALLLDDIATVLKDKKDLEMFQGKFYKAQVYLINKVYEFFKEKYNDIEFIVCPTEYWGINKTEYKNYYKENVDKNVIIIWTGKDVISSTITKKEAEINNENYGHNILLWDNFPVNDGNHQLKMSPLRNRDKNLYYDIYGVVSNPANEAEFSKLILMTYADYCWNPDSYIPEYSFNKALKKYGIEDERTYCELSDILYSYNLKDEEPIKLNKLIDYAVNYGEIENLKKYLCELKNMPDKVEKLSNKKFSTELKPYMNKLILTVNLGLCAIDIIEGKKWQDLEILLLQYKEEKFKFGGNKIIELVEYVKIKNMSIYEKLTQLFMARIKKENTVNNKKCLEKINKYKINNIYFSGNYKSLKELKNAVEPFKKNGEIKQFIGAEHEGGDYCLVEERFSKMFSEEHIGKVNDKGCAFNNSYLQAMELKTLGFNFIFAPVINILDSYHEMLKGRCFGKEIYEDVIFSALRAFKNAGIIACSKYYPVYDRENTLKFVPSTYKELQKQIEAFNYSIKFKSPALLISEAIVEELDSENPANMSQKIIKQTLQNRIGYEGIITSKVFDECKIINQLRAGVNFFIVDDVDNLEKIMDKIKDIANSIEEEDLSLINTSLIKILKAKEDLNENKIDETKFKFYEELREDIGNKGR